MTCLRCGGIFNDDMIGNLLLTAEHKCVGVNGVKEFLKIT